MKMSNSSLAPARRHAERRHVKHLELHVTHACNLTCESCSHYSNHNHHGHVSLSDADRWMAAWSSRVFVDEFHLLGGEPTIHPDLTGFVSLVRRHWPETIIRIRTNGFFLHRHPDLPELLAADKGVIVSLAVHHDSPEYRERLQDTFDLIERWQTELAIVVEVDQSFKNWTQRYLGFGANMQPFEDGAPRASWEICAARECMQLLEGKIWKCGPLAYLSMQKAKYRLSPKWDFYLGYEPLEPSCNDSELDAFLAKEDEPYCGMCSGRRRPLDLPNPVRGRQTHALQPLTGHASAERTMITTEVKTIRFAETDLAGEKWRPYPLFSGRTRTHDDMACHYSLLGPGHSPHPPHTHVEEEILIVLKGEADILIADGPQPDGAHVERLRPGSFVYYPAYQHHTIRNCPEAPIAYLMFKWRTESKKPQHVLGTTFYHFDGESLPGSAEGFAPQLLFESPTAHLGMLHAHITHLQPGAGYPPHADAYDVAIVVLAGQVETLGQKVEPFSVIYYSAGEMHGMKNVGDTAARYLVFEFHGRPVEQAPIENTAPPADTSLLRRGMRAVRRQFSELLS